jgi:hypothetical protein
MNIGIWTDTEENLAAMKISAWHKAQGDSVERWFQGYEYDIIYACKIFGIEYSEFPEQSFKAKKVICGGTGFDIVVKNGREKYIKGINATSDYVWTDGEIEYWSNLLSDIEHIYPDYELFGIKNRAIGFTTRGCPNKCGFCLVSCKEGVTSVKVADISEFWRGQKEIDLMDANLLACPEHEDIIRQLIDSKARVTFSQGLDARFITEDNARLLSKVKIKTVHFALDLPRNTDKVIKGLLTYRKHSPQVDMRNICVYVLTNYDTTFAEDYERVKRLQEIGLTPDVRIYRKETAPQITKDLARWCNNRYIYRSCPDFMDYIPRADGKTIKQIYFGG